MRAVCLRIVLFDRDAIVKGVDGDIVGQMGGAFVDQRNHGGVEFVFNGKHGPTLVESQAVATSKWPFQRWSKKQ